MSIRPTTPTDIPACRPGQSRRPAAPHSTPSCTRRTRSICTLSAETTDRTCSRRTWRNTIRTSRNFRWNSLRQERRERLTLPPVQFFAEDLEVAPGRGTNQTHRDARAADADLVARVQLAARLAVEGHEHLVALVHHRLHPH